MSSANHAVSVGGGTAAPQIFNPPASFAEFNFNSLQGFHYSEASFQHQLAHRDTKTERYQQKEAFPRPDGISQDEWKKAFNSADSWVYKQAGDDKLKSLKSRQRGHFTREKAEEKLKQKLLATGRTVPGPDPPGAFPPTPPPGNLSSGNNSDTKPPQQLHPSSSRGNNNNARRGRGNSRKTNPRNNNSDENPVQQVPSSSRGSISRRGRGNSRKNNSRKSLLTQTLALQTVDSSSRGNNPPQAPEDSQFTPSDDDPTDTHRQPTSYSDFTRKPYFFPGERNQYYLSHPEEAGPVYNNLYTGHRDYTRLGAARKSPYSVPASKLPEPSSSTNNSNLDPQRNSFTFSDREEIDQRFLASRDIVFDQDNYSFPHSVPVPVSDSNDLPGSSSFVDLELRPTARSSENNSSGNFQAPGDSVLCQNGPSRTRFAPVNKNVTEPASSFNFSSADLHVPSFSFTAGENSTEVQNRSTFQNGSFTFRPTVRLESSKLQEPSSFTEISATDQRPQPFVFSGGEHSTLDFPLPRGSLIPDKSSENTNKQPSFKDSSKFVAQQPSSSSGGTNPNQGFEAPRGSVFYRGSYSSTPQNGSGNIRKQSSFTGNSNISAQQPFLTRDFCSDAYRPSSSKDASEIGAKQTFHSKSDPKIAAKLSSKENSKIGAQQLSSSKTDPKIASKLPSSKDNCNTSVQQSSSSKADPKIARKQSLSKGNIGVQQPSLLLGSEIASQGSSSKAKPDQPKKMSSQAKKQKGKADYCVCKQVKHGQKMIACEGGCENWFHVSCLDLLCDDTDGVAKFICDDCEGTTTYKRVCRLEGCNRPHSTTESVGEDGKPKTVASKYCSLEHRNEFWARTVAKADPLLVSQLRSYMEQTSLGDFKTAGDQPTRAGLPEVKTGPPYNEEGMFSFDTNLRDKCHKNIARLTGSMAHYENRAKLVAMIKEYSSETTKKYAEENKVVENAPKRAKGKSGKSAARTICGFDPRVTVSRRWIEGYMATPEGDAVWKSGVIGEHTNPDFQVDIAPEYYKGICVGTGGCHPGWLSIYEDEPKHNLIWIAEELAEENTKLNDMIARVQQRLAIEREREQYAQDRAAKMTEASKAGFLREWKTLKGDKDIILRMLLEKYSGADAAV
ncbi:hypothetical protein V493_06616 [Pseudogymnoascus sp. VKM F-4281 (FW-2241)]|nr:hypothetical protein V493_06616 [Pseudogymnoascus sp. VKM F-4281 (FW-2241)]